jgi:peptide deformylase
MELKIYPDSILRVHCEPVREVTDEDAARMEEMLRLMYREGGVGLAGPQAGWASQVVTLDVEGEEERDHIFLNPRIIHAEGECVEEEGCLSVPGIRAPVRRAERVVVAAYALHGERIELEAEGLLGRAWQHEVDHLRGVLFIDRLEPTALVGLRHSLRRLERDFHAGVHGSGEDVGTAL